MPDSRLSTGPGEWGESRLVLQTPMCNTTKSARRILYALRNHVIALLERKGNSVGGSSRSDDPTLAIVATWNARARKRQSGSSPFRQIQVLVLESSVPHRTTVTSVTATTVDGYVAMIPGGTSAASRHVTRNYTLARPNRGKENEILPSLIHPKRAKDSRWP